MSEDGEDLIDTFARRLRNGADSDSDSGSDSGGESLADLCAAVGWPGGTAAALYELALRCTHRRPKKRPELRGILAELRQLATELAPGLVSGAATEDLAAAPGASQLFI